MDTTQASILRCGVWGSTEHLKRILHRAWDLYAEMVVHGCGTDELNKLHEAQQPVVHDVLLAVLRAPDGIVVSTVPCLISQHVKVSPRQVSMLRGAMW